MRIIILAVSQDGFIADTGGEIPWDIPYDLKWFKMNTMNSTIGIRGWVVKHGIPYKNHWSIAIILIFK
jgi:dihydrofolate reductase